MTTRIALALVLCLGCGGDDGGSADTPDAGSGTCEMRVSFEPLNPVAPVVIVASATITREGYPLSVETFEWDVTFDGQTVPISMRDADGREIEIPANAAGNYRVALSGRLGGRACVDDLQTLSVQQPGANARLFRLRLYPAAGQDVPVQQRVIEVPGGADYSLGTISLDTGVPVDGAIQNTEAAGLPSFLRFKRAGDASWPARELFSDQFGRFSARLSPGSYDLLVVPTGQGVAPRVVAVSSVGSLIALQLPAGNDVSGTVADDTGTPLVGASVSIHAAGAPSTIATTQAGGTFSLLSQTGAASLVVRPPPGTGLPRLVLDSSGGLAAADGLSFAVVYAPTTVRVFDVATTRADGTTPAPGAQVTFVARSLANAGTVTPSGGAAIAATGEVRVTAIADGAGAITGLRLPEAVYDVIVVPAAGEVQAVRLTSIDLTGGAAAPAALSLAAAGELTGTVKDEQGAPLAGVRVTATPTGILAGVPGAAADAVTDTSGQYAVSLVGGGRYTLSLTPGALTHGGHVVDATAPAAGETLPLADVALPAAIEVIGEVSIPGASGAAGVYVQLLCYDCAGAAATAPIAEAVSDITGRFVLRVPDPGTSE